MTDRMKMIGLGVLVAAAIGVMFAFDPTHMGVFPPCPLHKLTGVWCPGCGSTRALHQLLHGNLMMAFQLNPLVISLLPLVGSLAVRGKRVPVNPVLLWVLLGMVVVFGVLRNVPVCSFAPALASGLTP